jgi:hypothetical protein
MFKCATVEQLKLVLTRANSLPLRLRIQWPVELGTLGLLASLKHPIHSLTLLNKSRYRIMGSCVSGLNLATLQALRLEDLDRHEAQRILGSMSQSNHSIISKIKLDIHRMPEIFRVLGHQLFQRVIEMSIRFGQ